MSDVSTYNMNVLFCVVMVQVINELKETNQVSLNVLHMHASTCGSLLFFIEGHVVFGDCSLQTKGLDQACSSLTILGTL